MLGYDFLCCGVYIPPESSDYSNVNMFEVIEEEFASLHNDKEVVCLLGDFNSRTKTNTDLLGFDKNLLDLLEVDESLKDRIYDEKLLDELGHRLNRKSQDDTINNYGYRMLEMCKNIGVYILNGRMGKDTEGSTTCDNTSLVDYILASPKLFPHIVDFEVQTFDPHISDIHNPIYMSLGTYVNIYETMDEEDESSKSDSRYYVKWSSDKVKEFKDCINKEHLESIVTNLGSIEIEKVDKCTVDTIVGKIEQVFKDSAKDVGIMKPVKKKIFKRKTPSKPWFNKECEFKRNIYMCAKNKYAQSKAIDDRKMMVKLNKEYKACLKKAYRTYRIDFNNKIRDLKCNNPKLYWDLLKEHGSINEIAVDSNELYNHFKNLSSGVCDKDEESNILRQGMSNSNDSLDGLFTQEEIMKCIRKLKNNKSSGLDLIINEYLKYTSDLMLPIYEKLFNVILETGIIPSDWLEGMIIPLYKNKGDKTDCNNYRGITLLSCFGKLFTSVLNERLRIYLDESKKMGSEQAAYRKDFSTLDHIFTIKCLIA